MQTNSTTTKTVKTKQRQPAQQETIQRGKQWKRTDKRKLDESF